MKRPLFAKRTTPVRASSRMNRYRSGTPCLAIGLLLATALTPAIAQETCGSDPATSPNNSANYILGSASTDGMAMHWTTGLVWKRCAEGQSWDGTTCTGTATTNEWNDWMADYMPKPFTDLANWWSDIGSYSPPSLPTSAPNRLLTGAWRLPYKNALQGLTTGCQDNPAINRNVFPNTSSSFFWSGSPNAYNSDFAWNVNFDNGNAYNHYLSRNYGYRVRLVRGGQSFAPLVLPPSQIVSAHVSFTFGSITLHASDAASGHHAWGGARIDGAGNPVFEVSNSGQWVTEAIVTSGDTIRVRLTSGAPGSSLTATLVVHSANTIGTNDSGSNDGDETATLQEAIAEFIVQVPGYNVTASAAGDHGSITPASQAVAYGGMAGFAVSPHTGYHVASVTGDTCTPVPGVGQQWLAASITTNCAVTASFALDQPALVLGIDDGGDYVRYGQLLTYQVSLSNQGTAPADATVAMSLDPALDAANTHWVCIGAGTGADCTAQGQGALYDSNVSLPAGTDLHWLVTAPVRVDASGAAAHTTVNASAGSSNDSADDQTTLVILRTGFDVIGGDGAERLALPAAYAVCTAGPEPQALDASFVQTLTLQANGARVFDTALRLVGAGGRALSVQRAHVGASTLLRLVSMDAHGQAHASHWARVEAGSTLALGVAVGATGQRVALLEGADTSLRLPLPLGMQKARLYTPPGTARVCGR